MSPSITVKVQEIILHILSAEGGELQLSEIAIPAATTNQEVFDYFATHIATSLASHNARLARFNDTAFARAVGRAPQQGIAAVCQDLLAGRSGFVAASRDLATRLHQAVQGRGNIAEGDLVVCRYEVERGTDAGTRLALLKIKPIPVFEHDFRTADGHNYITLVKTGAMPSTREELQKCAFLRPLEPRPTDFDMILLDRQADGEEVARFFQRFLDAELVVDDRQANLNLHDVLVDLENRLRPQGLWGQVATKIRTIQGQEVATLGPAEVAGLGLPPDEAKALESALREERILARPIPAQRAALARARPNVRYVGDYGFTLEIPAGNVDDVVQRIDLVRPSTGQAYYEILLHTTRLERRS